MTRRTVREYDEVFIVARIYRTCIDRILYMCRVADERIDIFVNISRTYYAEWAKSVLQHIFNETSKCKEETLLIFYWPHTIERYYGYYFSKK